MRENETGAAPSSSRRRLAFRRRGAASGARGGGEELAAVLAGVPLFARCTDDERREIAVAVEERTFPAGTALVHEGSSGDEAYVVVDGFAEALVAGSTVGNVRRGTVVGELSLIDRGPRSATVRAVTDVRAIVLPVDVFWAAIDRSPALRRKVLLELSARLRSALPHADASPPERGG